MNKDDKYEKVIDFILDPSEEELAQLNSELVAGGVNVKRVQTKVSDLINAAKNESVTDHG